MLIRVAILQRILPDFRYDVFKLLSEIDNYSIKVFFGKGQKIGAARNTSRDYTLFAKQMFTIPYLNKKYRVFHPTLIFHLLRYNPDVIITEPSTYFPNNFIAFIYAKIFRKKFIWWEAGLTDSKSSFRKIIEPFIRLMIKKSNSYICYSSLAKKWLIDEYGINSLNIFTAQNTIYNDYTKNEEIEKRKKEEFKIGSGDIILSYIGSLEKRKKLEILLDIANEIYEKKIHILLIGDGKDFEYYKSYTNNVSNNKVHFIGRKEKEEANHYLALSDFTVLPAEGGLAINHALSVGTPVICGKNDGTEKDIIKDGFNGFILDNFSTKKIMAILPNRKFIKENIKIHFDENYSINKMVFNIISSINHSGK